MAAWEKGRRHQSRFSNSNIAVWIFATLFLTWVGFLIWARFGGGPAPSELPPMVMTALGVAITTKSADEKTTRRQNEARMENLENFAKKAHPEIAEKVIDPDVGVNKDHHPPKESPGKDDAK